MVGVGVGFGEGEVEVSGMVIVCVLLQSLVPPEKIYGYISNWFVALGLKTRWIDPTIACT